MSFSQLIHLVELCSYKIEQLEKEANQWKLIKAEINTMAVSDNISAEQLDKIIQLLLNVERKTRYTESHKGGN